MVALNSRNTPPNSMIRSRPEKLWPSTSNSGLVRVTSQAMLASRPRRISSARPRPISRARSRWCGGSLSARMAMNTRLSMPSTISRTIRVSRPIQAVGSAIHSITVRLSQQTNERAAARQRPDGRRAGGKRKTGKRPRARRAIPQARQGGGPHARQRPRAADNYRCPSTTIYREQARDHKACRVSVWRKNVTSSLTARRITSSSPAPAAPVGGSGSAASRAA
ncbi:hypothetical protein D3C81_1088890 [compost metagenome]